MSDEIPFLGSDDVKVYTLELIMKRKGVELDSMEMPILALSKLEVFRVHFNNFLHKVILIPGVRRVDIKQHGLEVEKASKIHWTEINPMICPMIDNLMHSMARPDPEYDL